MSSSLVKFSSKTGGGARKLFWSRADEDGLPFRGPAAPIMPEGEYQERVVRVSDFRNEFFDVTIPEQNEQYREVMECCQVGWFRLVFLERFWRQTNAHYVEWYEYYMEDGTRTPFMTSGMMEAFNGPANFLGHHPESSH